MGLFGAKCAICGGKCGMTKFPLQNNVFICLDCGAKAGFTLTAKTFTMTTEQVRAKIAENEKAREIYSSFQFTNEVKFWLRVNEQTQQWVFCRGRLMQKPSKVYSFSDLESFELLEDGETLYEQKKFSVGRALVGGALFGDVGAVIGGLTAKQKTKKICKSLRIKLTLSDSPGHIEYIDFVDQPMSMNSNPVTHAYNCAPQCLELLQFIWDHRPDVSEQETQLTEAPADSSSLADELMKWKKLLDMGAISQEEYDLKKAQILTR